MTVCFGQISEREKGPDLLARERKCINVTLTAFCNSCLSFFLPAGSLELRSCLDLGRRGGRILVRIDVVGIHVVLSVSKSGTRLYSESSLCEWFILKFDDALAMIDMLWEGTGRKVTCSPLIARCRSKWVCFCVVRYL
jgi:hypothetical protein